jgi:hypothetical protein
MEGLPAIFRWGAFLFREVVMSGTNGNDKTNGWHGKRKLNPEQAGQMKGKWARGATLRTLAAEYGIAEPTVAAYCNDDRVIAA